MSPNYWISSSQPDKHAIKNEFHSIFHINSGVDRKIENHGIHVWKIDVLEWCDWIALCRFCMSRQRTWFNDSHVEQCICCATSIIALNFLWDVITLLQPPLPPSNHLKLKRRCSWDMNGIYIAQVWVFVITHPYAELHGALLLTWITFNHTPSKMWGETFYPFPNLNGAMDKKMYPILYNRCNYLSMLGLKLNHVSKWEPS